MAAKGYTDTFGNRYRELDLEEAGVDDVSQLHFSNVFGSTSATGNGFSQFLQALSLHGAQAQAAGLSGIEYEAGLKGISMDQMFGDMWDMTHTEEERAAQGSYSGDRAKFIMDQQQALADLHNVSLGEYQQCNQSMIQSSMGSAYGSESFHYNEPAQSDMYEQPMAQDTVQQGYYQGFGYPGYPQPQAQGQQGQVGFQPGPPPMMPTIGDKIDLNVKEQDVWDYPRGGFPGYSFDPTQKGGFESWGTDPFGKHMPDMPGQEGWSSDKGTAADVIGKWDTQEGKDQQAIGESLPEPSNFRQVAHGGPELS